MLIGWIKQIVTGGSIGLMMSGADSSYLKTGKGLRQGDLLSLLCFIWLVMVFLKILVKAASRGLAKGIL